MPGHLRCDSTHGAHTARDVQLSLLASPHGSEGIADEGCDWCGEIGAFRVAAGYAAWSRLFPPMASRQAQFRRPDGAQGHAPLRFGELVAGFRTANRVWLRLAGVLRKGQRASAWHHEILPAQHRLA